MKLGDNGLLWRGSVDGETIENVRLQSIFIATRSEGLVCEVFRQWKCRVALVTLVLSYPHHVGTYAELM